MAKLVVVNGSAARIIRIAIRYRNTITVEKSDDVSVMYDMMISDKKNTRSSGHMSYHNFIFISNITHHVLAALYPCLGSFPHPPPSICTRHRECDTAHQQAPSLHASSDRNVSRYQRMLIPRRRNTCKRSASSGVRQLTRLTCIVRFREHPSTSFVEDHNHHHLRVAIHSARGERV